MTLKAELALINSVIYIKNTKWPIHMVIKKYINCWYLEAISVPINNILYYNVFVREASVKIFKNYLLVITDQ